MTPAEHSALPPRVRLAKTLLGHAHTGRGIDVYVPRIALHQYVITSEDTIEQQAKAMRGDQQWEQQQDTEIARLHREVDRLNTEAATLRQLAEAALTAAEFDDNEALNIVRQALERTA